MTTAKIRGPYREDQLVDLPTVPTLLQLGARVVDLAQRRIEPADDDGESGRSPGMRLTRTESAILRLLAQHAPATVHREELLRTLWNLAPRSSRTLDTHMTRLRRKVEDDPAAPRFVLTVYRVGYRLELPVAAAAPARVAPTPNNRLATT